LTKYVVVLIVVLFAMRLLLARSNKPGNKSTAGKALHPALESTVRKTAIAVGGLVAALVIILLIQHLTS
jgi:hypothetical protein